MKNVTIYEVVTDHIQQNRVPRKTRYSSLRLGECVIHAQTINKREGVVADILEGVYSPVDHTTPEARAEKAARAKVNVPLLNVVAEEAGRIRAERANDAKRLSMKDFGSRANVIPASS